MMFGTNSTFHHVGVAVRDITKVGTLTTTPIHDPLQKVRVAFADIDGCPIEYIEPASDDSPITQSIKKNRVLVHLCFEVDNINDALEHAQKNGCVIIHQPQPASAFDGRHIAWIYHPSIGLVELLERHKTV